MGWLKCNAFEHLPNTTRALDVCVVMERSGIKLTRGDVVWAKKLVEVGGWSRMGDRRMVGDGQIGALDEKTVENV